MKKLCTKGFKVSEPDKKAFEHYVLVPMVSWTTSALSGMINKAVKTIMRDWYEKYKEKQTNTVSSELSVIIHAIIAMEEFTPYNYGTPEVPIVQRTELASQEIWQGGFDVEDYEEMALKAFYSDPEAMLRYFMENKVFQRKKAFLKEHEQAMLQDKDTKEIPARHDDFINMVCGKAGYKNRVARDLESI